MKHSVKGGLSHRDICKAAAKVFGCIQHCSENLGEQVKGESAVEAANADGKIRLFFDGYKVLKNVHRTELVLACAELIARRSADVVMTPQRQRKSKNPSSGSSSSSSSVKPSDNRSSKGRSGVVGSISSASVEDSTPSGVEKKEKKEKKPDEPLPERRESNKQKRQNEAKEEE